MYILKNANSFLTNAEVLGGSGLAGRAVAPTAKAQNFLSASCLKKFSDLLCLIPSANPQY